MERDIEFTIEWVVQESNVQKLFIFLIKKHYQLQNIFEFVKNTVYHFILFCLFIWSDENYRQRFIDFIRIS